jgi:integrase
MSVHPVDRQDGSRGYKVRWREHGRNRARTFKLKRDADAFDREAQRRRQLGPLALQQLTSRKPSLSAWIADCWAPEHAATLEQSTRDRYANVYAVHIEPWLGERPLDEITVGVLRAWQADRAKAGVRPGTIHKCRTLLSSVLRHAAEAQQIPANPLGLVRAPKAEQRDAVTPLAPSAVERIRGAFLQSAPRTVDASRVGQRPRQGYELPSLGTTQTRQRDALIVSLMAYAGLRPGELRALRWGDVGERTINVQRAADPDGSIKATKNKQRRSVRLLDALAQDLREYRLVCGRPGDRSLVVHSDQGESMSKSDWQVWRRGRWAPACSLAGLDPTPRPYDLRHGFASLLLAEGRQPLYVSRQLGHSVAVLLDTYAHLIDEYEDAHNIDANAEIRAAREGTRREHSRNMTGIQAS